MKRFTLTLTLVSFALLGFSQTQQGAIMAGGTASLQIQNQTSESGPFSQDSDATTFSLGPVLGFFIVDNIVVGGNLSATFASGSGQGFESSSTAIEFGPFGRYYTPTGIFAHAGVGFGFRNSEVDSGSTPIEFKDNIFTFEFGGGYAIFLNDHVSLEPMVLYNYRKTTDRDASDVSTKFSNIIVQVGFNIFLHSGD